MIVSFSIGAAQITGVCEFYAPTHDPDVVFPDLDRNRLEGHEQWLVPRFWYPEIDRFVIAITMWIVRAGGETIVVDTGYGNGKIRTTPRANALNSRLPEWLAAAGVSPASVTAVAMTHLHSDHIGWNTVLEGERWVPFFPNARYFAPEADFRHFAKLNETGKATDGGSYYDSLMPIKDAGLLELFDDKKDIAGVLEIRPAPGHTPGHVTYWLSDAGQQGVFSGDIFHHPAQILDPNCNTSFCVLPEIARRTRRGFLETVADTGAIVMPCHFPPPHAGTIERTASGFRFTPISQRADT